LARGLREYASCDQGLIGLEKCFEEGVKFLSNEKVSQRLCICTWNTNLFVMLFFSSTGLKQHKALRTFDFFFAQPLPLPMFDGQLVSGPVNKFKGRKNLREISPGQFEKREDVLERGEGQNHVIDCSRSGRCED